LWEKLLSKWEDTPTGECAFVDSTFIKVHKSGSNPSGGNDLQAMGRTKGGLNTKIHAAVNEMGRPICLMLSPGNDADVSQAPMLLESFEGKLVVADKAYDSDHFRHWLSTCGSKSCIPPRANRRKPAVYSKATYRLRRLVENYFERLKRFRRVATRYDKLAETFFGFVCLAAAILAVY
jgi:transposase